MVKKINLRNLDQKQKELVDEKVLRVFKGLDFTTNVYFEKHNKGGFRGRVDAQSKWGKTSVEMERKNLIDLCHQLKKKVQNQVIKSKMQSMKLKNNFSEFLPNYNFVHEPSLENHLITSLELKNRRPLSALIIDDDIDALLPIEKILRKFGCHTSFAIDEKDAVRKINQGQADIIVLDWLLGKKTGNDIIETCTREIRETEALHEKFRFTPPKIVTYSGLKFGDISFTSGMSQYFSHVDHWNKPISFGEIESRTNTVLNMVDL